MKNIFKAVIVGAGVMLASNSAMACGKVTITEMNWASSAIVTSVAKFLMEQGYGCEVTTVPSSTVPAIASVAETNEPDIVTELWVNAAEAYGELEAQGKIAKSADVLSDGGIEGWWVPAYLVETHPELATIDGILANPDLVGGMFHNCPDGWGCRTKNDNLFKAFGFEKNGIVPFNHGSGETLATSIASAYQDKKPWFGYYWAPTSVLGKYPMVQVDAGPYVAEVYACISTTDCDNIQKTAYPAAPVITALTTDFSNREPAIADLMKNLTFTNQQMGSILAWQEENNASADEAAVYFLTTFKDVWGSWLNDSAREKLSNLLS